MKFAILGILIITKMCGQFQCVDSETCCIQFKHVSSFSEIEKYGGGVKVKFAVTSNIIQNVVFKQVLLWLSNKMYVYKSELAKMKKYFC